MPFRFHSLAIPHTVSSPEYNACAFTQKIVKFSRMMFPQGHVIYHYGHPASNLLCTEHVSVTDDDVLNQAYGSRDWRRHQFEHNINDVANQEFIRRAVPEITKRARPGDFLLCWWGIGHQPIADAVKHLGVIAVEPGIGWTDKNSSFADWKIYESHAVRNTHEGLDVPQRWYSRVIPNYFDAAEFEYRPTAAKEPWVLFLSRVSAAKGVEICVQATQAAGVDLKIAGQGCLADMGILVQQFPHVEELGYADVDKRRDLLSRASALIIASTYNEPFGGVQVEALLSGTPIITPFYGAFAEVNVHGVTGFHCSTLKDFQHALLNRSSIDSEQCRLHGMKYCLDAIAPLYESYFADVSDVFNGNNGWMKLHGTTTTSLRVSDEQSV